MKGDTGEDSVLYQHKRCYKSENRKDEQSKPKINCPSKNGRGAQTRVLKTSVPMVDGRRIKAPLQATKGEDEDSKDEESTVQKYSHLNQREGRKGPSNEFFQTRIRWVFWLSPTGPRNRIKGTHKCEEMPLFVAWIPHRALKTSH